MKKIILAADELSLDELLSILRRVGSSLYAVKVHAHYDAYGTELLKWLRQFNCKIFLDAKLHDIPNTVKLRAAEFKKQGVDILTVHASGGFDMMKAARESGPSEVYGITALTSLNDAETLEIYNTEVVDLVRRLTMRAFQAELSGVVCSPQELEVLHDLRRTFDDFKFVTPGIRLAGGTLDDQKRTGTPVHAVRAGAHHLVIGRAITKAEDPLAVINMIERSIEPIFIDRDIEQTFV